MASVKIACRSTPAAVLVGHQAVPLRLGGRCLPAGRFDALVVLAAVLVACRGGAGEAVLVVGGCCRAL
ncbi:hypothetical protein [Streptomyces sp. NRRL S-350]|uniref:hypothetical protein n=1 Tax=Streptomyces sp. NRRL S-350 TaxID=1463902 RepID=UPI00131E1201|nr:hypothetical protein [Streptomyces sp. NRRL S-350]